MRRDVEDTEKFFDPVRGPVEDACDIPWMDEERPQKPVQALFREAATMVAEGAQDRLQSLLKGSPLLFATMGGFRA